MKPPAHLIAVLVAAALITLGIGSCMEERARDAADAKKQQQCLALSPDNVYIEYRGCFAQEVELP